MKDKTYRNLTVVFADPSPVIHLNEPCTHRRVTIVLTDEQSELLKLRWVSHSGGVEAQEIPTVFILENVADKGE